MYNSAKNRFDLSDFRYPGAEHAPVYSWVWNAPLSREKTMEQLNEMIRMGIRAFYIIPEPKTFRPTTMVTELEPDYLTPEFFSHVRFAFESAEALGMKCWIYDEGGWPSGGACGRVLKERPETARRRLGKREISLAAGETYHPGEDTAAAFCGGRMISGGFKAKEGTSVTEYFSVQENRGGSDYPDITREDTTDYFIKLTHEGYRSAVGDLFGKSVGAVFTDEPKAPGGVPFRDELQKAYEEKYGESVIPYLPVLRGDAEPDEKGLAVRRRWYDLCSRFFCDNFLLRCKKWTNDNGMAFTGHMDKDDDPDGCMSGCNYQIMRALRCLDIPGVDAIWRQIFPSEPFTTADGTPCADNRFYPRYASSAAAQTGGRFSLTESFGVYGSGTTYEQMRYTIGFQAIRGINIYNLMIISYAREGAYLAGEQPGFNEDLTGYDELFRFNRWMERVSYLVSLGDRICDTALYYPVSDYWGGVLRAKLADEFDSLGRELEDKQIDFDIFDDDLILAAEGEKEGNLCVGLARYRNLVIPEDAYIPPECREKLDSFSENGGMIYHSALDIPSPGTAVGDATGLRVMRRTFDGGQLICLFNQSLADRKYTVRLPDEGYEHLYLVSPEEGRHYSLTAENGTVGVEMRSGEFSAVLMCGDEYESKTPFDFGKADVFAASGLKIRRLNGFVFGEKMIEPREYDEVFSDTSYGDWAAHTGKDFSGTCKYITSVRIPKNSLGRRSQLDLGGVKYTAEVIFNGESIGTRLMPPYRFDIPAELPKEENTIEIIVTNTPANQYFYTKTFDKWEKKYLSPYFDKEKEFYPDSLPSGLYGPVRLLVEKE